MTDLSTRDNVGVHASRFKVFLLKPELLRALFDFEFEYPSDVQYECIPEAIIGKDIICEAKSGMGKTALFVLSTLHQIDPSIGQVSALVLCRTSELSGQICNEFERFCRYLPDIKFANIHEDAKISIHKAILGNKSPHIVVGTPRRIMVLATLKDLSLTNIRHVILDECEQMLERLDLSEYVHGILEMTPIDKQVMMFSATLRKEIRPVCRRLTRQPKELYVDVEVTLKHIEQFYLRFKLLGDENQLLGIERQKDKNQKLEKLLNNLDFDRLVIFVNDFRDAIGLAKLLDQSKFSSMCFYSGMLEEDRLGTYIKFKEGRRSILVANDLVIREIDIAHVDVIVNYDRPDSAKIYLRRVGRLGNGGLAVTFVAADPDSYARLRTSDRALLDQVEKDFQVKIWMLPDNVNNCRYSRKRGVLRGDVSLGVEELYGDDDIFDPCLHDIDLMMGTL